jgi:hypothetical protein
MPARSDHSRPSASPAMLDMMRIWRAAHPQATFAEIEVEAMRQVAARQAELIATALAVDEPDDAPTCDLCGRVMARNGTRRRTIVTGQQERVTIHGQRYRCSVCGTELSPPR